MACLLILALSMIALGVSATAEHDFSALPKIVYETIKAALGNVQRSS